MKVPWRRQAGPYLTLLLRTSRQQSASIILRYKAIECCKLMAIAWGYLSERSCELFPRKIRRPFSGCYAWSMISDLICNIDAAAQFIGVKHKTHQDQHQQIQYPVNNVSSVIIHPTLLTQAAALASERAYDFVATQARRCLGFTAASQGRRHKGWARHWVDRRDLERVDRRDLERVDRRDWGRVVRREGGQAAGRRDSGEERRERLEELADALQRRLRARPFPSRFRWHE